jgi:hypothetical protein
MKRFLGKLYEYWLAFGFAIGRITTPVWLLAVYLLVFGPSRLVAIVIRRDPLERYPGPADSFWKRKDQRPHTIEESRRQF